MCSHDARPTPVFAPSGPAGAVDVSRPNKGALHAARIISLFACVLPVFMGSLQAAAGTDRKPHIVFMLADDLGRYDAGFMGGEDIKTPHLDKLAKAGAVLDAFYVQSVCSPTRAALMTGRYPMRYGLQVGVVRPHAQYGLPLDERTLPQALKEAGYTTAICGKWHLGHFQAGYLPTRRGFDHQYGHYNGAIDYFTHIRDGGFDWHRDDKVNRDEGYSTSLLGDEAVRLIERQDASKPLFLYVPFNAPHTPLQALPEDLKLYESIKNQKRRQFAAMVHRMDVQVGRIADAIEKRGWTGDTLFIFSSDNGGPTALGASNGPYRAGKGTLYEGGTRVAAFASWPSRIRPGIIKEPLHMVDWFPTLLKLSGAPLEQKHPLDGRDIWPVLNAGASSPHDAILLNTTPATGAIRMGSWKLVLNGSVAANDLNGTGTAGDPGAPRGKVSRKNPSKTAGPAVELFNLADDPYEKTNLAGAHPEKVGELRARLDAYAREAAPPKAGEKPRDFRVPEIWGETGLKNKR